MCLNGTESRVRIGKHLSDSFPIQSVLKQEDASTPQLLNFALEDDSVEILVMLATIQSKTFVISSDIGKRKN
jgi:hypothetical protein